MSVAGEIIKNCLKLSDLTPKAFFGRFIQQFWNLLSQLVLLIPIVLVSWEKLVSKHIEF